MVGVTRFCDFPEAAKDRAKIGGFSFGDWFWNHQYRRVIGHLGGIAHPLVNLDDLLGDLTQLTLTADKTYPRASRPELASRASRNCPG